MQRKKRKKAFTLVELLVVIAIIGILIALLLPAVQAAREAARRTNCNNKIKQIVLAFHNYYDSRKVFPAYQYHNTPSSWSSWRGHGPFTMILPYIEQENVYEQVDFNTEWDNSDTTADPIPPTNFALSQLKIDTFICPTDGPYVNTAYGGTNYAVCGGSRRSFYSTGNAVNASGVFVRRRETRIADIRDGTSNVVMIGEINKGDDAGGQLTLERDFTNQLSLPTDQFPPPDEIETAGVACDAQAQTWHQSNAGRQWMASFPGFVAFNTVAPPNWKHVSCCEGGTFGYACDRNGIVPARSFHPGGVQVGLADGSARFISETIDLQMWQWVGARADKNPITW